MLSVESKVLGNVNAPYGVNLTSHQLALSISDIEAAQAAIGPVFSFFTEVSVEQQQAFVEAMALEKNAVAVVAKHIQAQCANPIALAA